LPTVEGRKEIFHIYTKQSKDNDLLAGDIDYDLLAISTEGSSGAAIHGLYDTAARRSLERLEKLKLSEEDMKTHPSRIITMDDFKSALTQHGYFVQGRFIYKITKDHH